MNSDIYTTDCYQDILIVKINSIIKNWILSLNNFCCNLLYNIFFLLHHEHERLLNNRFISFPQILSNDGYDQPNLKERKIKLVRMPPDKIIYITVVRLSITIIFIFLYRHYRLVSHNFFIQIIFVFCFLLSLTRVSLRC